MTFSTSSANISIEEKAPHTSSLQLDSEQRPLGASLHAGRSSFRYLIRFAAGLVCVATLAVGATIWWLRSNSIREAFKNSDNLAILLADQSNHAIETIDLVVSDVKAQLEHRATTAPDNFKQLFSGEDTYQFLMDRLSQVHHAERLWLVDKDGWTINTTRVFPAQRIDVSDRDYFQHFKNNNDRNLYISQVIGDRGSGARLIVFGKRIDGPKGEFLGVISMSIRFEYFENIYQSIASIPDQSFLFLHRDGTVIVRYPDPIDRAGEKIPLGSPWFRLVSQGGGHYRTPGYFDLNARLVAVQPLGRYPLVVDAGISEAAALATWRTQAITISAAALLVLFCFLLLLRLLNKQYGRLTASETALAAGKTVLAEKTDELENVNAKLADAHAQANAALNNISQGLVMFDSSNRLVVCNRRYLEMYGLSSTVVRRGATLQELIEHRIATGTFFLDDPEQYVADILAAIDEGSVFRKLTILRDERVVSIVTVPISNNGWVATHEDITEQRRAETQIVYLAHHDALTGLLSREHFHEQLEKSLLRAGRGEHFALLYLDLDDFKTINDTLGHSAGDELLKAVAGRLQNCVRDIDTLARLGGDEFAIIQHRIDQPSDVAYMAARIQESIKAPCEIGGHELVMDVSIGIALAPSNGDDAAQLLKNADLAMYQAKADGRGTYRFFEAAMDARVKARSALEFELRQAITCNQFELYYQPVVDVQNNSIMSCEALLRWHHPQRGTISPSEFMTLAEDTGLINQIGVWVLKTACMEAVSWPDNIKIAVNVSPIQFKNSSLILNVMSALGTSGLPANRLELEITETALIKNEDETLEKINKLRELGIQIALDDFGTGYSSLSYLQRVPFDKVKIDRSFIENIPDDAPSLAIVQAIIKVGKVRNHISIAEGVETELQRKVLSEIGCCQMQGFLFSPPVPEQELSRFFLRRKRKSSESAEFAKRSVAP